MLFKRCVQIWLLSSIKIKQKHRAIKVIKNNKNNK